MSEFHCSLTNTCFTLEQHTAIADKLSISGLSRFKSARTFNFILDSTHFLLPKKNIHSIHTFLMLWLGARPAVSIIADAFVLFR